MKIKDLIAVLEKLNPEATVLLSSDAELNTIYNTLEVAIYNSGGTEGEIELTPENVALIKEVIIYGWTE
jgi:hypothetical protein